MKKESGKINKTRCLTAFLSSVLIVVFLAGAFAANRLLTHESQQSIRISSLEKQIVLLKDKINSLGNNPDEIFPENAGGGVNYLAIGNSITLHPLADYWWAECGMAASSPENDYFHLVKTWLDENYDTVNALAYNFSVWEILHTDRAETLDVLDTYLSSNLNLITIQLGENVSNLDTFESDFEYLLNHVKEKAPDAQIIVLGEIMDKSIKDEIKERVSEKCGADFISFDEIQENAEYQCGKGTTVYDKDGKDHTVEHDGVALHPNDKAMKYIADRIIEETKSF